MAKTGSVQRNDKRKRLVKSFSNKRKSLKLMLKKQMKKVIMIRT